MNHRLAAILLVGLLPWSILVVNQNLEFVFLWGLVNTYPMHIVSVVSYVGELTWGLPERLLAWPISTVLYACGVLSAASGAVGGREDRRLTAGLFVIAGASHLVFAIGIMARNPEAVAVPLGVVAAWVLVWWFELPHLTGNPASP